MVIPPAQPATSLRSVVEGPWVKQKVTKPTTCGNATSTHRKNSKHVSHSRAKSTHLATTVRKKHDEAGPSRPHNIFDLGLTTRLDTVAKSQKREPTKDTVRPSCNVFDRLGQSRGEDMRTHLEARRNSVTSRRREELSIVSPINDEINELRARLKELVAKNTEAAPSTSTSPFSAEIQQAPLPAGFRIPTMATYEGKTDPQDYLDVFNDQMDLLQVTTLTCCRCFVVTLSGTTKKWIKQIELEIVVS